MSVTGVWWCFCHWQTEKGRKATAKEIEMMERRVATGGGFGNERDARTLEAGDDARRGDVEKRQELFDIRAGVAHMYLCARILKHSSLHQR
mmetsp:Transcript_45812/g.107522  ORF Transcript_45812/g.107522 Transcript_45812/m.107522 type:complete len:91 (+) Transcript_45812:620-892(+)